MFTVSMFEGFNKVVQNVPLDEVIHSIKAGVYQKEVEVLRALETAGHKTEFENRKKALPAFTPSGTFSGGRKPDLLTSYSQCIILDIDHLDFFMLQSLQQSVLDDPLTLACFVSPSGKGLKIIAQVDSQKETHKLAFEQVKDYFEKKYSLTVDKSGKDLTRLCFVSFDPAASYNPHATVFHVNTDATLSQSLPQNVNELFASCVRFTQQKEPYTTGNRNNFVFQLACNLNRKGMSQAVALNLILEQYD